MHAEVPSPESNNFPKGQRVGALIYSSINLGDNIQSLAQLSHLPKTGENIIPCHREHLNESSFPQNTLLMLNGWFTHEAQNWPPSENILPIFIGFHIADPRLADKKHTGYYKQFGPIGCRDTETVKLLEKIGVDAYLSRCPTLTLVRPHVERTDEILVVDTHLEHADPHVPDCTDLLRSLVPAAILERASYVSQRARDFQCNWYGYRAKKAAALLARYARAKLVITSRLHCALPCLAFGTPCVFIHKALHTDPRLKDYASLLRGYSNAVEKVKINWDKPDPVDIDSERKFLNSPLKNGGFSDI
jgi:hypothetical protein